MQLANPDAFHQLKRADPEGQVWKNSIYEDVFGYKRPVGRSEDAYKLMAKVERESSPEEIEKIRKQEILENKINKEKYQVQR